MKAIDKIIFNELASRRAVVLPGLGTLGVVRRTAQITGREVKAPVNQVVYSRKEAEDAPSVVALMENMGVGADVAESAYAEWLAEVSDGDSFRISGVGEVRQDFFTPSTELEQMLNPSRTQPSAAAAQPTPSAVVTPPAPVPAPAQPSPAPPRDGRRNGNCLTNILLIILIVVVLVLGCLCLAKRGCCCGEKAAQVKEAASPRPLHVVLEEEPVMEVPVQEVAPPQAPTQAQTAAPRQQGGFHLIAGSFLYESNADEMIAKYKRLYPDLAIEKIASPSWVMVSVYQSSDRADVAAAERRLADRLGNHEMWVYRKR